MGNPWLDGSMCQNRAFATFPSSFRNLPEREREFLRPIEPRLDPGAAGCGGFGSQTRAAALVGFSAPGWHSSLKADARRDS